MAETLNTNTEEMINGCTISKAGRAALMAAAESGALESPTTLRREMLTQFIEIADAYDSLDHRIGGGSGGPIQDDCQAVRELIRSMPQSYA